MNLNVPMKTSNFEKYIQNMYASGDIHRRFDVVLYDGTKTTVIISPIDFYGCSVVIGTTWLDNGSHFISDVKSWRVIY